MNTDSAVWYKQFWPWFILAFPLSAMVIGFTMLYVGIVTYDGVVVDQLEREGRMMKVVDDQDRLAREQNLLAELSIADSALRVNLSGVVSGYPDSLDLHFVHPTRRNRDIYIVMSHQGRGVYTATAAEPIVGEFQLQLHPPLDQTQWRVYLDRVAFPLTTTSIELRPKAE